MYSIKWSFGGLKRIMKSAQLIVFNFHFGYLRKSNFNFEFNFDVRIFCLPGRSDLLTVSLSIFLLFYVKFCFQNVL